MKLENKFLRFLWRMSKNGLCLFPVTRHMLFPPERLAASFGRSDAEYALRVFKHHFGQLRDAGFSTASRILEVGPGANLGTALLWWAYCEVKSEKTVEVVCWDVFKNASPELDGYWENLARELLLVIGEDGSKWERIRLRLWEVAEGGCRPRITYRVESLQALKGAMLTYTGFELIYSHAAVEHIWHIEKFWESIGRLTQPNGWHSHHIDLADHGSRETNYIEMLEWSQLGYWLTMRFVPGAINRWRACHHLKKCESLGMRILYVDRQKRSGLPIPLHQISPEYRVLGEDELRTTSLYFIAKSDSRIP